MARKDETYPAATWAAALSGDLRHASMTGDMVVGQEAAGTRAVVAGDTIPRQGSTTPAEVALLTRLGFTLGDNADDLFRFAALPEGWTKAASEDHRTTLLRDGQGRERGLIWYKAAFYDRDAYMVIRPRFRLTEWPGETTEARDWQSETRRYVVEDSTSGVVFASATYRRPHDTRDRDAWATYDAARENAQAQVEAWLIDHYPTWADAAAYWD